MAVGKNKREWAEGPALRWRAGWWWPLGQLV